MDQNLGDDGAEPDVREALPMRSRQGARVHLKILKGGDYPPGGSGSPMTRVPLGPGEWALVPGGHTRLLSPAMIRDVLRGLELSDPIQSGERYRITRVQPAAMAGFGPALLRHSGSQTVLYCQSDQIAPHAADCLAALAARTAKVIGEAAAEGSCQVKVARISHRDLPADLHPAVTTVRGSEVTVHICARLIAHDLAAAMSAMGAEFGSFLVPGAAMRPPHRVLQPGQLALAGPGRHNQ